MRSIQATGILCALLSGGIGAGRRTGPSHRRRRLRRPWQRRWRRRSSRSPAPMTRSRSATGSPRRSRPCPAASAAPSTPSTLAREYAPFWTEPGSTAPAALAAALDARRRRRCRGAPTTSRRWPPLRAGRGRRRRREREVAAARAYLGFADDLAAGVLDAGLALCRHPGAPVAPGAGGAPGAARHRRRCLRCSPGFSPPTPTTRRLVAEKARLEALAPAPPGARRSPTARPCTRATTTRGSPRSAPGWRGSATSCRPARPPAATSTRAAGRGRGLPGATTASNADGVVGVADARRDQRAGRDPAGAGRRQPRAAALD